MWESNDVIYGSLSDGFANTAHKNKFEFERLRKYYKFIRYEKWQFRYCENIYKNLSNQSFNVLNKNLNTQSYLSW